MTTIDDSYIDVYVMTQLMWYVTRSNRADILVALMVITLTVIIDFRHPSFRQQLKLNFAAMLVTMNLPSSFLDRNYFKEANYFIPVSVTDQSLP